MAAFTTAAIASDSALDMDEVLRSVVGGSGIGIGQLDSRVVASSAMKQRLG